MFATIVRRVMIAVPLLLGMSFVTFLFIDLAPGDYFDTLRLNPEISQSTLAQYEKQFMLDQPVLIQYGAWLGRLARGDLGYSFAFRAPVARVIGTRVGNTLVLALTAMVIAWIGAVPLGILCATRRGRWPDRTFGFFAVLAMSVPTFFSAMLLLYLASQTGWLPIGGVRSSNFASLSPMAQWWDVAQHLVIPSTVLGLSSMAGLIRVLRGNMLEALASPFILAARGRGVSEQRVLWSHALPNALNPMITIFGYELSGLLSGAALTEIICNWPGLGSLMLTAVRQQDLFLVMGDMLIGGVLLLLGNLLADIGLAWLDPRIRF